MPDNPQAKGGRARAAALTPERRAEIAREAARKRWGGEAKVVGLDIPTVTPRPKWRKLALRCLGCENEWVGWVPSGVPIRVYAAVIREIACPRCAAESDKVIAP